jgi:DNA-3-methyladenine glycosylase II
MVVEQIDAHKFISQVALDEHKLVHELIGYNGRIYIPSIDDQTFFEFIAKTVVGQQLSNKAASTIWGRIKSLAKASGIDVFNYLNHDNFEKIKACGVSQNKMKAIFSMKEHICNNPDYEANLASSNYEELTVALTSIWGIGSWTADMVAIFFMKLPDVYPQNDKAIHNGLTKLSVKGETAKDIIESYSPYMSYLCLHIWSGVDNGFFKQRNL